MQIKLIQTEIEDAIRNYIQEQVTVKDGMEINIDLSATRGPEGFIANVEIVRAGTGSAQPAETAQPAPAATPATPVRTPSAIRKAAPIPAKPAATAPVEAEINENAAAADVLDVAEEAPQPAAEATEAAPATPAPAAGRSLFGGLSKPTNS